jgi:hypothetical protein
MRVGLHPNVESDPLNDLGFVFHNFSERSDVDVIEIPEDVRMLWCPGMGPNQRGVPLQRILIILNADAASVVQFCDVGAVRNE